MRDAYFLCFFSFLNCCSNNSEMESINISRFILARTQLLNFCNINNIYRHQTKPKMLFIDNYSSKFADTKTSISEQYSFAFALLDCAAMDKYLLFLLIS